MAAGLPWLVKEPRSGMELLLVPPGDFVMGEDRTGDGFGLPVSHSEGLPYNDETPEHRVRISRAFYVGRYEVTQQQYQRVMGQLPQGIDLGPKLPVYKLSWNEITAPTGFLARTSLRLLTEAEWEYVADGLHRSKYPWGDAFEATFLNWGEREVDGEYACAPVPVGTYPKGRSWCGAFELCGNVEEWCEDVWEIEYYAKCARQGVVADPVNRDLDPRWPVRATRGNMFWVMSPSSFRCAFRSGADPARSDAGFRCAWTP